MSKRKYYLAASLMGLRSQLNKLWPDRDKRSDGWIGDPGHQARVSDHNPDYADGGVVRAIDIDIDGIDVEAVLAAVTSDSRVSYVIYNRRIWGGSRWRAYDGSNPHTAHIHVSIKHTAAAERAGAWSLGKSTAASKPGQPTDYKDLKLTGKLDKPTVQALQIVMRAIKTYSRDVDGQAKKYTWMAVQEWLQDLDYYPADEWVIDGDPAEATIKALQEFLADRGHLDRKKWLIDGDLGPATIKALQSYLNTQN